MLRRAALVMGLSALVISGCSGTPPRAAALSPTAASGLSAADTAAGMVIGAPGLSGPMDVLFPARNETVDFRSQLETKYRTSLQRGVSATSVDPEGDAVWIQEYIRYRTNGCDHATAVSKTLSQVDGNAASAVCTNVPAGNAVTFPPRNDTVDFRRQLETKYQATGRGASSSAVDGEGSAIWTQEYLRYRTNSCSHDASVQNVFTQIDGNPAPATCYVAPTAACAYRLFPSNVQTMSSTGGSSSVELVLTSGSCNWTASTNTSWITLSGDKTGGDRTTQAFTVSANTGGPRTGFIDFTWTGGGGVRLTIDQSASPFNLTFKLYDYSQSINDVTECQIRTSSTTCTLSSATNALPSAIATYDWRVEYTYGSAKVKTQSNSSPTFAFTEACGSSDSGGTVIDLSVRLTVTDTAGNTATIYSGQGFQPALRLRTFTCP